MYQIFSPSRHFAATASLEGVLVCFLPFSRPHEFRSGLVHHVRHGSSRFLNALPAFLLCQYVSRNYDLRDSYWLSIYPFRWRTSLLLITNSGALHFWEFGSLGSGSATGDLFSTFQAFWSRRVDENNYISRPLVNGLQKRWATRFCPFSGNENEIMLRFLSTFWIGRRDTNGME